MKMTDIGIHGKVYTWIKSFLTNRTIQTKVNDALSSKEVLEEGLPQGSCLSCTLFLVYIKDMEEVLDIVIALYADDLVLWVTRSDIQQSRAKLKISEPKTVYTIFTGLKKKQFP